MSNCKKFCSSLPVFFYCIQSNVTSEWFETIKLWIRKFYLNFKHVLSFIWEFLAYFAIKYKKYRLYQDITTYMNRPWIKLCSEPINLEKWVRNSSLYQGLGVYQGVGDHFTNHSKFVWGSKIINWITILLNNAYNRLLLLCPGTGLQVLPIWLSISLVATYFLFILSLLSYLYFIPLLITFCLATVTIFFLFTYTCLLHVELSLHIFIMFLLWSFRSMFHHHAFSYTCSPFAFRHIYFIHASYIKKRGGCLYANVDICIQATIMIL